MHQTTAFTRVSLTSLYTQCSRAGTPISLYDERTKTKPSILRYLPLQQAPFYPRRLLSCPWMLWLFQVACFRSLRVYHRRSKHKHKMIIFCFALWLDTRYCAFIITIRFVLPISQFGEVSFCYVVDSLSLNQTLTCDHSKQNYWTVLFWVLGCCLLCCSRGSNFWVCEWNPEVYLFK